MEIQEGIYDMLELFIDLVLARIKTEPVPVGLLNILATVMGKRLPACLWSYFGGLKNVSVILDCRPSI